MLIRSAKRSDMTILIEMISETQKLHAEAYPDMFLCPFDRAKIEEHFDKMFTNPTHHILLLEDKERVVGHIIMEQKLSPANAF